MAPFFEGFIGFKALVLFVPYAAIDVFSVLKDQAASAEGPG